MKFSPKYCFNKIFQMIEYKSAFVNEFQIDIYVKERNNFFQEAITE
jgi:hypothetical protein